VEHVASVARLRHVEAMVEEKRRRRRDARRRRRVVGVEAAEAARARMKGGRGCTDSKEGKPGFGGCAAGAREVGGANEQVGAPDAGDGRLLERARAVALRARRELGCVPQRCSIEAEERAWRRRRLVLDYLASW
jgi:hypothetical protein